MSGKLYPFHASRILCMLLETRPAQPMGCIHSLWTPLVCCAAAVPGDDLCCVPRLGCQFWKPIVCVHGTRMWNRRVPSGGLSDAPSLAARLAPGQIYHPSMWSLWQRRWWKWRAWINRELGKPLLETVADRLR